MLRKTLPDTLASSYDRHAWRISTCFIGMLESSLSSRYYCGVPKFSQLGHNPNLNWDSPRGPVPIPKKAPPWVGTTPSQRPYSAYIRRITPHLWPFLYSKIHSHSLAFAHSHLGSKEHVPFWFLSLFWWFWGVVPICPNSVSTCPNSELWILVFPNFGIVVSFCGYNEI